MIFGIMGGFHSDPVVASLGTSMLPSGRMERVEKQSVRWFIDNGPHFIMPCPMGQVIKFRNGFPVDTFILSSLLGLTISAL